MDTYTGVVLTEGTGFALFLPGGNLLLLFPNVQTAYATTALVSRKVRITGEKLTGGVVNPVGWVVVNTIAEVL